MKGPSPRLAIELLPQKHHAELKVLGSAAGRRAGGTEEGEGPKDQVVPQARSSTGADSPSWRGGAGAREIKLVAAARERGRE